MDAIQSSIMALAASGWSCGTMWPAPRTTTWRRWATWRVIRAGRPATVMYDLVAERNASAPSHDRASSQRVDTRTPSWASNCPWYAKTGMPWRRRNSTESSALCMRSSARALSTFGLHSRNSGPGRAPFRSRAAVVLSASLHDLLEHVLPQLGCLQPLTPLDVPQDSLLLREHALEIAGGQQAERTGRVGLLPDLDVGSDEAVAQADAGHGEQRRVRPFPLPLGEVGESRSELGTIALADNEERARLQVAVDPEEVL